MPHAVPSLLAIVHACMLIIELMWQVPPMHVAVVVVTDCMPLVPQGMLGMHGPMTVPAVPHDEPSVFGRVHACDSLLVAIAHDPE